MWVVLCCVVGLHCVWILFVSLFSVVVCVDCQVFGRHTVWAYFAGD